MSEKNLTCSVIGNDAMYGSGGRSKPQGNSY